MSQAPLPIVRALPADLSLEEAFVRLASLPGCLWFDSAARGPRAESGTDNDPPELGRYSFLTADPVETMEATIGQSDPWLKLANWIHRLPRDFDSSLPPFQGGIAGLWGYEAATWLESIGVAERDDLPTPAISLGLYDWTIAVDHKTNRAWIISQGMGSLESESLSTADRLRRAGERVDQVQKWLAAEPSTLNERLRILDRSARTYDPQVFASQHKTPIDGVHSNFTSKQFREGIDAIVESIRRGDSFQVNLAQRLLVEASSTSPDLYLRLRRDNPAPFGAYYGGGEFQVLSSSPEGFLRVRGRRVETRPIKGTVPRTGDAATDAALATQLLASEKDRAENVMIVDLLRNDLSRVCIDDSVKVTRLWGLERYECVQHLVSVIEGELAEGRTVADLLRVCFPGGSVTGAPKIEAMKTIARLEPNRRGPYCGSIGYISCGGNADFNILIRTITAACGYWQIPVGGGITARSHAEKEEAETWAKAKGMLRAVLGNPNA